MQNLNIGHQTKWRDIAHCFSKMDNSNDVSNWHKTLKNTRNIWREMARATAHIRSFWKFFHFANQFPRPARKNGHPVLSSRFLSRVFVITISSHLKPVLHYTRKNAQVDAIPADENRIEQCFAAHIVHSCQQYWTILLHPIQAQQHCSILLTSVNNVGRKTLFSPVTE
jgi:hypothetical protein